MYHDIPLNENWDVFHSFGLWCFWKVKNYQSWKQTWAHHHKVCWEHVTCIGDFAVNLLSSNSFVRYRLCIGDAIARFRRLATMLGHCGCKVFWTMQLRCVRSSAVVPNDSGLGETNAWHSTLASRQLRLYWIIERNRERENVGKCVLVFLQPAQARPQFYRGCPAALLSTEVGHFHTGQVQIKFIHSIQSRVA